MQPLENVFNFVLVCHCKKYDAEELTAEKAADQACNLAGDRRDYDL